MGQHQHAVAARQLTLEFIAITGNDHRKACGGQNLLLDEGENDGFYIVLHAAVGVAVKTVATAHT